VDGARSGAHDFRHTQLAVGVVSRGWRLRRSSTDTRIVRQLKREHPEIAQQGLDCAALLGDRAANVRKLRSGKWRNEETDRGKF
jgi:hypothetical protein